MTDKELSDYITFPRTFEKYRWFKPILVLIIGFILMTIFQLVMDEVFYIALGPKVMESILFGGYESIVSATAELYSDLVIIIMIPALFIATKIVRDRPFSSYMSSRGGWNYRLYFKALVIPLILFLVYELMDSAIEGPAGTYNFTLTYLIVILICGPLQCIAEEFVFRGLFMQTFGAWFKIPILAIVLQAIIFMISHGYNAFGLVEIFVSGCVFGFFAWKTNGIEVSSALHTANNISISLMVMFGIMSPTSSPSLVEVIVSIVFIVLLAVLMYYIGKRTNWFGELPE